MELEPIDPETAVELYLTHRENDVSQATLYAHDSRLGHLTRWCDQEGIENLNNLTGRKLQEYRLWRREDGDLAPPSEKSHMDTIRVFIRWVESIDGVPQDLSEKVLSPSLSSEQHTRDVMLESDRAKEVLTYLEKYQYASLEHVTLALMWHTMMRIGSERALDVDDYYPDEQYLNVEHRPETETPLKNQHRGERLVALSDQICELLDDWLADQRPDIVDDHGREPLLATVEGRIHISTLRKYVYQHTRPCVYDEGCPHNRDPDTCEATEYYGASKCPSSVSPHAIRRGGITHSLNDEVPVKVVTDRADVSPDVLSEYYHQRTDREKMEQRRDYIDDL